MSRGFLLIGSRSESIPSHLQIHQVSALTCFGNGFATSPRTNCIKSKYVSSCCKGFHKPCLDVSSPPDLLPSPPVVCVHVFLPFVLQHIFIKAAISKLPFIKTKQPSTNTRKQRGQAADPQPRRRSHSGGRGRAAAGLPRRGPRLSLQLRCHPFYKPHGYTQLWSASAHQRNL